MYHGVGPGDKFGNKVRKTSRARPELAASVHKVTSGREETALKSEVRARGQEHGAGGQRGQCGWGGECGGGGLYTLRRRLWSRPPVCRREGPGRGV